MRSQEEHEIQKSIIEWARYMQTPICLLFAIPNGGERPLAPVKNKHGEWIKVPLAAKRLKAEGVLAGVPDLFLPLAAGGFHGLFIEVKSLKGVLSPAQKYMTEQLAQQGYAVRVVRSVYEGINAIREYSGQ